MTAAENDEPTAGEYAALLAILEKLGNGPPPIPLWNLSGPGWRFEAAFERPHRAGLPDERVEVRAEAGRLAAAWTARRS